MRRVYFLAPHRIHLYETRQCLCHGRGYNYGLCVWVLLSLFCTCIWRHSYNCVQSLQDLGWVVSWVLHSRPYITRLPKNIKVELLYFRESPVYQSDFQWFHHHLHNQPKGRLWDHHHQPTGILGPLGSLTSMICKKKSLFKNLLAFLRSKSHIRIC